jgi:hypothetical protein
VSTARSARGELGPKARHAGEFEFEAAHDPDAHAGNVGGRGVVIGHVLHDASDRVETHRRVGSHVTEADAAGQRNDAALHRRRTVACAP